MSFMCDIMGDNYLNVIDTSSRFIIQTKDKIIKFGKWSEIDNVSLSNENHIKKTYVNSYNFESWSDKNKFKTTKIDDLPSYKDLTKLEDLSSKEKQDLSHEKIKELNKLTESIENLENNLSIYDINACQMREDCKKKLIEKTQKRIMEKMSLRLTIEREIEDLYQNSDFTISNDDLLYNYGF